MGKIIFAQDTGYGTDKYAYRNAQGKIKLGKVNSAIAEAPDESLDTPLFEKKRYYLGDIALLSESKNILNVIDYKDHEKFAPLSLWHALQVSNVDDKDVGMYSLGLSLAQKQHAKEFMKRMASFNVDKVNYKLQNRMMLFPQAVGAKYAIDELHYKDAPDDDKNYAIVDIGQLTVDLVTVFKGKTREENASGMAHLGIVKITQDLEEYIASNQDMDNAVISMKEAQEILLSNKFIRYGETFDLTGIIDKFKKEYTKYLLTNLADRHKNIFQKIAKIYLIGGGVYYLDKDEMANFKGFPVKSLKIPEECEYYNAMGNLLGAEKAIMEGKFPNIDFSEFNQPSN
ncbi:ParM/StbA family protein [Campylobacter sp. MOP7]|uniref:ParM/StbA family protein n=1 Tax=Campylobacter canis TaxID=3378588 RepID=UPI00387E4BA8